MIIYGIDPGKLGGIAVLEGPSARVYKMPLVTSPKGRDEYDLPQLVHLLQAHGQVGDVTVFLERGQPLPPKLMGQGAGGSGSIANYNRGYGRGLFEGILVTLQIPYQLVAPISWQRVMLEGTPGQDTKQRSVIAAQRLFPAVSLLPTVRSRKPSDGLSDALLIAAYGKRRMTGGANPVLPGLGVTA